MANDVEKVIEASESLRISKQGRYLNTIAEFCLTKYEWSFAKTVAILENAIVEGSMMTTIKNNKLSYRINSKNEMECDNECKDTQTDCIELQSDADFTSDLERLQNEFEEYKRFSHGEILDLKAKIAIRPNSPTQAPRQNPNCDKIKEALLTALKERIISLERQLYDKQKIIEKLLDGPKFQASPNQEPNTKEHNSQRTTTKSYNKKNETAIVIEELNNGADQGRKPQGNHLHVPTPPQHNSTKGGKKGKSQKTQVTNSQTSRDQQKQIKSCENRFAVLSTDDKDQNEMQPAPRSGKKTKSFVQQKQREQSKPIEESTAIEQEKNGSNSKTNSLKKENKRKQNKTKQNENAPKENIHDDAVNWPTANETVKEGEDVSSLNSTCDGGSSGEGQRKRVFVLGDSIINGIEEKGLSKKHNVRLRKCPGDSTEDLLDHVKPVARKKPDLIVIHFGTNDTTSGKDTKENVQKAIDTIKEESPSTEIAISLCTIRKDRSGLGRKVESCNKILRDVASRNNTYVIDNKSIDESCLGMKRLHLNRKGTSFLANNLKNFIDDI